jgi:hypothetical protein
MSFREVIRVCVLVPNELTFDLNHHQIVTIGGAAPVLIRGRLSSQRHQPNEVRIGMAKRVGRRALREGDRQTVVNWVGDGQTGAVLEIEGGWVLASQHTLAFMVGRVLLWG